MYILSCKIFNHTKDRALAPSLDLDLDSTDTVNPVIVVSLKKQPPFPPFPAYARSTDPILQHIQDFYMYIVNIKMFD